MIKSSEVDLNKEIEKDDMIEIEVPVLGIDYVKASSEQEPKNENTLEINEDVDTNEYNAYTVDLVQDDVFTKTSDHSTNEDILTFTADFQTSSSDETTNQNIVETTTQIESQVDDADTTTVSDEANIETTIENQTDGIQAVESKLIEQWKATDSPMIDESLESKLTVKPLQYPKNPFNVKIFVNNDDEKESCKLKASCNQIRVSRPKDLDNDPEFYDDYSDEDLYFANNPKMRPNMLRSRNSKRAADDVVTPASRLQPFQSLAPIKKPSFIEQWENESSLEKSERFNKNLDGLMRVVGVWAHVDKFVSSRARSAIKKLAFLTGDDYDDNDVGSRRSSDRKRTINDDPFT